MSPHSTNPEHDPTPEQLLAFADGELDPRTHAQVERWLAQHPEVRAEVEAERHLLRLYRETPAPEPTPAAWEECRARLQAALPLPEATGTGRKGGSRWVVGLLVGLLTAAAVLGGMFLARPLWPVNGRAPQNPALVPAEDEGPFAVATAQEINIISMDAIDADAILLGPPLMGSFELAEPEDIELLAVGPHPAHGRRPQVADGPVAMIMPADEGEGP
jgi:anti-sigma factor RsiW